MRQIVAALSCHLNIIEYPVEQKNARAMVCARKTRVAIHIDHLFTDNVTRLRVITKRSLLYYGAG